MKKDLPIFFVAGGDDPVGAYGTGVEQAAQAFRDAGMVNVKLKLYPLYRHEILNEINADQVYDELVKWISEKCL